ncbi:MAG: sugar phosphate isomerase/epimerase [Clostridiaceae bacterium]|nr:sugar phosphate isomerase/epimerase [Clostridiaceae bacterium]
MNIVYGAFADEYAVSLEGQIEGLVKNNFEYIEIRFVDGKNIAEIDSESAKCINEALKENGISVFSIGSPIGKIDITDDLGKHIDIFERICNCANVLESKYIRMFSFYNRNGQPGEEFRKVAFKRVEMLLDLADRYGVTLCHENEEGIYGEAPERCLDLLKGFEGRLRCVFDMGNFVLKGYDPLKAYELLYEYLSTSILRMEQRMEESQCQDTDRQG